MSDSSSDECCEIIVYGKYIDVKEAVNWTSSVIVTLYPKSLF